MGGIHADRYVRIQICYHYAWQKSDEASELNGFDCGADEYISKPFSPKILTARVDALIRRSYSMNSSGK